MRRTRKWSFVAQEATRLAALGLSPREIAARLDVSKSTVTRWMASGKLTRAERAPVTARPQQTPAEWADAVRQAYDLDATDEQLVTVAEAALALSLDVSVTPAVRMNAAGRFQAIVRQLSLVTRGAEKHEPEQPPAPVAKKNPTISRPAVDPRKLLAMVS